MSEEAAKGHYWQAARATIIKVTLKHKDQPFFG
jgi:hypothetical protein